MSFEARNLRELCLHVLADLDGNLGGNLLGQYIYESGETEPAIWAGKPPSDLKVIGLECNIPRLPPSFDSELAGSRMDARDRWEIRLTQREYPKDPTTGQPIFPEDAIGYEDTLPDAVYRLRHVFPLVHCSCTEATETTFAQAIFRPLLNQSCPVAIGYQGKPAYLAFV